MPGLVLFVGSVSFIVALLVLGPAIALLVAAFVAAAQLFFS